MIFTFLFFPAFVKVFTSASAPRTLKLFFKIFLHILCIAGPVFACKIVLACPADISLVRKLSRISSGSFNKRNELEIVTRFLPTALAIAS